MRDIQTRERFKSLRRDEQHDTLSEAERAELAQMIREIESAEATYLDPAVERLRRERLRMEAQNAELKELVRRRERFVRRLERFLTASQAEQQAIKAELTRILGASVPGAGVSR